MDETITSYNLTTVFPFRNLDVCRKNGLNNLISELETISGQIFLPIQVFGDVVMNFRFSDDYDSKDFKSDFGDNENEKLYLIIETCCKIDINEIVDKAGIRKSNPDDLQPELIVIPYYRLLHRTYLTHFVRISQIAYPGSLWLDDAVVYSDSELVDDIDGLSSVLSEYDYQASKWPIFDALSIKEAWSYIVDRTNILTEFSSTGIERALNSFTYLFSKNYHRDIPVSLFWSLSGLEALYVTGEVGITQQLNDKIQVFLGEISENKRILKKLYNYRSGLIHGDLHVPINDGIMNDEKHNDDLYTMNSFSAIILVATLQKLIKRGISKLEFKYVYQ
jgi:hypothetical protein